MIHHPSAKLNTAVLFGIGYVYTSIDGTSHNPHFRSLYQVCPSSLRCTIPVASIHWLTITSKTSAPCVKSAVFIYQKAITALTLSQLVDHCINGAPFIVLIIAGAKEKTELGWTIGCVFSIQGHRTFLSSRLTLCTLYHYRRGSMAVWWL